MPQIQKSRYHLDTLKQKQKQKTKQQRNKNIFVQKHISSKVLRHFPGD